MTLTERIQRIEAERHMPTNVKPMRAPKERRALPRWRERMDAEGLPAQDMTAYIKAVA